MVASTRPTSVLTSIAVCRYYFLIYSVYFSQFTFLWEFQAARLSMNIRSITVERGIATLAHQTHLPTLLSLSRSSSKTSDNVSVEAISSRTGVPARQDLQEEWVLEGGHFDDDEESEGPGRFLERKDEADENEAIGQDDRRISRRADDDV